MSGALASFGQRLWVINWVPKWVTGVEDVWRMTCCIFGVIVKWCVEITRAKVTYYFIRAEARNIFRLYFGDVSLIINCSLNSIPGWFFMKWVVGWLTFPKLYKDFSQQHCYNSSYEEQHRTQKALPPHESKIIWQRTCWRGKGQNGIEILSHYQTHKQHKFAHVMGCGSCVMCGAPSSKSDPTGADKNGKEWDP